MNKALIIFIVTYIIIAVQNIPKIHISRPAGSLIGAVFMVLFGVLSIDEAYAAIDVNTILFILGMLIIVAYMEISGFFGIIETLILRKANTPLKLLLFLIISSGIFSSLFMNDTICLMFAPIVLRVAKKTNLNPIPYLIALATSSNIGSTMTIIGNPQNMLIGLYSKIPFLEFAKILAPVSVIGLALNFFVIKFIYRKELASTPIAINNNVPNAVIQKELFIVSLIAIVALLVFLSIGFSPPAVAMSLACFLILAGATKPRKVLEEVDWTLLVLFCGLFVVMKGVEKSGITSVMFDYAKHFIYGTKFAQVASVSVASAVVSNVISNVPAVILFSNIFSAANISKNIWLTLAMSSTLAGNFTIIGSIANIIVVESAKKEVNVSFLEYLKVGIPLTMLTLIVGILGTHPIFVYCQVFPKMGCVPI